MKKQQEYDAILKSIAYFPEGASSEEIRTALKWPVSRVRTVQRRLAALVKENRLLVEGASRSIYKAELIMTVSASILCSNSCSANKRNISGESEIKY